MNFAFSEEQEELRRIVRQFLEDKSSEAAVREQMDTEKGYDDAVWGQMADQMGLQGASARYSSRASARATGSAESVSPAGSSPWTTAWSTARARARPARRALAAPTP